MRLTAADEALLSLLREDARASTAQIARRLGLSRTTVQSRIERLQRSGVIAGYTVRVADDFGRERIMEAYAHAIHGRYRFFSYGDAMLLWAA